jgi:hypothetical protein
MSENAFSNYEALKYAFTKYRKDYLKKFKLINVFSEVIINSFIID